MSVAKAIGSTVYDERHRETSVALSFFALFGVDRGDWDEWQESLVQPSDNPVVGEDGPNANSSPKSLSLCRTGWLGLRMVVSGDPITTRVVVVAEKTTYRYKSSIR